MADAFNAPPADTVRAINIKRCVYQQILETIALAAEAQSNADEPPPAAPPSGAHPRRSGMSRASRAPPAMLAAMMVLAPILVMMPVTRSKAIPFLCWVETLAVE